MTPLLKCDSLTCVIIGNRRNTVKSLTTPSPALCCGPGALSRLAFVILFGMAVRPATGAAARTPSKSLVLNSDEVDWENASCHDPSCCLPASDLTLEVICEKATSGVTTASSFLVAIISTCKRSQRSGILQGPDACQIWPEVLGHLESPGRPVGSRPRCPEPTIGCRVLRRGDAKKKTNGRSRR